MDVKNSSLKERLQAFVYINSHGGFYIFRDRNLGELIILPRAVKFLPLSVRACFQVHENVHHLQTHSEAVNRLADPNESEEKRIAARAALEGPAVYCQDEYVKQFCSRIDKSLWKIGSNITNFLIRLVSMLLPKEKTPPPILSENEIYALGGQLAAAVARRANSFRMLELLSTYPPETILELRTPESYLLRLKARGLIN
ncbi:hypothetical protein HZC08_00625 [Candidatus Micrarchaeota archaeon]|nr:hypothetical protein [Candidatus Micrarchaeota archaeon]